MQGQQDQGSSPLILDFPDFSNRLESLFQQTAQSTADRDSFLQDPVGTIYRIATPVANPPDTAKINEANQLLFSLLPNPKF